MKMDWNFDLKNLDFNNIGIWPKPIKIFFISLSFLIFMFLGYQIDIKRQLNDLDNQKNHETELKNSYLFKQHISSNLIAYQKQYQEINNKFNKLLKDLPTQSEIPFLLEEISKCALTNGLEVHLFKPLPEKNNEFYAEIPMEISVSGNFHQIAKFISDISSLDRIVTFHDFILAHPKQDDSNTELKKVDKNKLLLEIKAKTYRYLGNTLTEDKFKEKA